MTVGLTSEDLLRDIRSEFLSTYNRNVKADSKLGLVMRLGIPSTKRTERFGYFESTPTLEHWARGDDMPEDDLLAQSYSVSNLSWGKAISFHEDDAEDVQLGSIREQSRRLGARASKLPQDVHFQILTAASSSTLLPSIPNAPDGAALFAATAGGAARFGVSGGNIITGDGVATGAAIRADFWEAMARFRLFQDTEGEELMTGDEIDAGVVIEYNAANAEVFHEAFKQDRTVNIVQNVAGTENVGGAAVTNSAKESGISVTLWPTQKISDNDWTITLKSPMVPRPMFQMVRAAPRVIEENRTNSTRARRSKKHAVLIDARFGFGINLPYGSIKVNN